jgi:hypothetical protein
VFFDIGVGETVVIMVVIGSAVVGVRALLRSWRSRA